MIIMQKKQKKLVQAQLDETLKQFSTLAGVNRPLKGWIRAIRDALGMNNRQLAQRLGVGNSRIPRIEQDEITGGLTLKTMNRVADELDCIFVYGFVPRTSLRETIRNQAESLAKKRFKKLMHTMELEDQGLSSNENKKVLDSLVEEIINSSSATLWEDIDR